LFESYLLHNLQDCILIIQCPWFAPTGESTNDYLYFSLIPFIIKGINITPLWIFCLFFLRNNFNYAYVNIPIKKKRQKISKSYLNADLDKNLIYEENKNKSGVYLWVNISNNNSYVGSSYNLSKRFTWYYSFNNLNRLVENSASLIGRAFSTSTYPSVVPVKKYANADVEKLQILKENKGKSGVYRWVHKESCSSYVGSSVNLGNRIVSYFSLVYLEAEIKNNKSKIYRALIKYGYSNFSFEILCYCEPSEVISCEQYYLDLLKPEYNILTQAGSLYGYKHPEGSKSKIWTLERKAQRRERLMVLNTSQEQKERSRERMKIISNSKEHQEHLKKLHLRSSHKVEVFYIITKTTIVYSSIRSAALAIGIVHSTIRRYLRLSTTCRQVRWAL